MPTSVIDCGGSVRSICEICDCLLTVDEDRYFKGDKMPAPPPSNPDYITKSPRRRQLEQEAAEVLALQRAEDSLAGFVIIHFADSTHTYARSIPLISDFVMRTAHGTGTAVFEIRSKRLRRWLQ